MRRADKGLLDEDTSSPSVQRSPESSSGSAQLSDSTLLEPAAKKARPNEPEPPEDYDTSMQKLQEVISNTSNLISASP